MIPDHDTEGAEMKKKYDICLDVGGTKVLGAIFNENKEIIYRLTSSRSLSAWWRR